jgi:hypothetical protein
MLKRAVMDLKALPADSMWTKREFPSERVDKLMENCLGSLPRAYPHSFTLCPHSVAANIMEYQNACGAIITIY